MPRRQPQWVAEQRPRYSRKPKTDRFDLPIWKLEVEFERLTRDTTSRRNYDRVCEHVHDFVAAYPEKRHPSEFYVTDVDDYLQALRRDKGDNSYRDCYVALRAFFHWLRDKKGLRMANPVAPVTHHRIKRPAPDVTMDEICRLIKSADNGTTKKILSAAFRGLYGNALASEVGLSPSRCRHLWADLRRRAMFPAVPMRLMRPAYDRLCMRLGAVEAEKLLGFNQVTI